MSKIYKEALDQHVATNVIFVAASKKSGTKYLAYADAELTKALTAAELKHAYFDGANVTVVNSGVYEAAVKLTEASGAVTIKTVGEVEVTTA